MKKIYSAPVVQILYAEPQNIMAGSPEPSERNSEGLFTPDGKPLGVVDAGKETEPIKGQGGSGSRAKGSSFWDDEW